MSSWNPGALAPKSKAQPELGEAGDPSAARASVTGAWRAGLASGVSDASAPALSGADAKKRLGQLLGVKRAGKASGAKKSAKAAKAENTMAGVGSALGPVADGAYSLACFNGAAAQAIKALDDGAQKWSRPSPQKRSPELFAISRGEGMAPVLQAAGPAPKEWLEANAGQALGLACGSKSLTILKMLLAAGASPDAQGEQMPVPLENALSRRWEKGVLALLGAGARLAPAGAEEPKSSAELLQAWKHKLGRALGLEADILTAEFERRALIEEADRAQAFAAARDALWNYGEPEFQAARETALGDGTGSLLPGVDWSSTPEPGEMARRLRHTREREKEAAKPKRAAKRM